MNGYNVQIVNSSPNRARSNGLAEKAIGIAKNIMKKSWSEVEMYALLEYSCTPVEM